jgi:hypothetical protein
MLHRAQCTRLLLVFGVLLASLIAPAVALGDGDPASDVLVAKSYFVEPDAGFTVAQQLQLQGLLARDATHGFPLRVAVIASPADLGSVAAAWRRPEQYARFLGYELSAGYHGTLVVVMPNGVGITGTRRGVWAPAGGSLAQRTLGIVRLLSSAQGVSGTGAVAVAPRVEGSGSPVAWIVLIVGAVIVLIAWALSLRARPLRAARP